MATNLITISHLLTELNLAYKFDILNCQFLTNFQTEDKRVFPLNINLSEEGEFIQFQVPHLLKIDDTVYKGVVLQTMALITHQLKMIRLEYSPTEGDVWASIELPLEDSLLTKRQFNRCLLTLVNAIDVIILPRLELVIKTGYDCGLPSKT